MFCNKCGKEIPDNSEFCNFCGNKIKANDTEQKKNTGCLIVMLVIMAILVFISLIPESETDCATCPSVAEMEDSITAYREGNIISHFQPQLNTVYITPLAEQQLGYNDLQTLGYITACYSAHIKNNNLVWVEIYSHQTNKKLAKYSQSNGFKVYDKK
jgi:predicted nucleic acid-binding Zn ribbon protein